MKTKLLFICLIAVFTGFIKSQTVNVDVNLNVNHTIDTVTTFDRSKFVTIHADVIEPEWDHGWGANFISDVRNDFLNGYDVFLGRNTGPITGELRSTSQDPNRSGYADTNNIATRGTTFKNSYASNTSYHQYEDRNNLVVCAQLHPFWPDGTLTSTGWSLSQEDTQENPFGTASGEYMAHFLKNYFGTGGATGQPKPELVEVINEPMWHLVDIDKTNEPIDIFRYHNSVAAEVKKINPDVQIGGWCTAFPDFEKRGFAQWEERWKMFMDSAGANMDFWTIHLYDFPAAGGLEQYRKGSNMEATFDMMEQYSFMKFGVVKDFMVSEYGASTHDYQGVWTPYRDWLHMKSVNSMMMQFMERANIINQTINFLIIKATWGYDSETGNTYVHRLMRKENEPASYTGTWIYSDMIKTYKLWKNVNGKRVDSWSEDLDILTDAYVDGDKAYIILNNLEFEDKAFKLNINEDGALAISNLTVKNFYLDDTNPVKDQNASILDEVTYDNNFPTEFTLKPEATIILEYTYSGDITIDEQSVETKYYADTYLQPITANTNNVFNINGVTTSTYGETVLRVGVGRNHGLLLKPTVTVNGTEINVPDNIRGDSQLERASFFGVLEIPVPNHIIQTNNQISVKFPDDGGHISSVTMQVYQFSRQLARSNGVSGVSIYPSSIVLGIGQERVLTANVVPESALDKRVTWSSSNTSVATVNASGIVTGESVGTATITTTTVEGGFTSTCDVEVQTDRVPVLVDTVLVTPAITSIIETDTLRLTYELLPVDADDKSITWSSTNSSIATVDNSGLVTAVSAGSVEIQVIPHNNHYGFSAITVIEKVPGSIALDDPDKYLSAIYMPGGKIEITSNYIASTGKTVDGNGIIYQLREMDQDGNVVDYAQAIGVDAKLEESGTSTASINLRSTTPSGELPEGNYYDLWAYFTESDGNVVEMAEGVGPIQIGEPSGINTTAIAEVGIYPNPAQDEINISSNSFTAINIYDLTGRTHLSVNLTGNSVNVSELPDGIYIVELSNETDKIIKRLILQR